VRNTREQNLPDFSGAKLSSLAGCGHDTTVDEVSALYAITTVNRRQGGTREHANTVTGLSTNALYQTELHKGLRPCSWIRTNDLGFPKAK
jgi:hypothetical protein